jgi:DNA-binding ferritin-like protein
MAIGLNGLLSNLITLYFTAHSAHWNVRGLGFMNFHLDFKSIYEELHDQFDTVAERIRVLDGDPSAQNVVTPVFSDPPNCYRELSQQYESVLPAIRALIKDASSSDDQGTVNMLANLIEEMEHRTYFINSNLE